MSESALYNEIRLELCKHGCRLFRNNVGLFETRAGTPIRTGLCPGSSDLIGWGPSGEFLAIEVKQPGEKPTPEQQAFIDAVNDTGLGRAFVATSAEDAVEKLLEV